MPLYTLKFFNDGVGLGKRIEFDAADAASALSVATGEAPNRNAELWQGTKRLCTIRRSESTVWRIGP
ncbi:MAG TPA: hypothetical protein VJQ77_05800 [Novosphingobium sp.]|nr:hypothetical protein [Novosphingobium sp.]